MVCKNTVRWFFGILRGALPKYWKVFWKIAEETSTFGHKINNLHVKTQGLDLFFVT